jgi:hypothetical protein
VLDIAEGPLPMSLQGPSAASVFILLSPQDSTCSRQALFLPFLCLPGLLFREMDPESYTTPGDQGGSKAYLEFLIHTQPGILKPV